MKRNKTKVIHVGNVAIGGDHPISIQSMTNTKTADIKSTIAQIRDLENVGCQIVRIAVPDQESAEAIRAIKQSINIPIIADIHFDYRLAIASINSGVDCLRLNPGNIGNVNHVKKVTVAAQEMNIPIRIGVNAGSIPKDILNRYGHTAKGLVEAALSHVALLERNNFYDTKISVKASSVPLTLSAYRLLAERVNYPLHVGITEAGTVRRGTVISSIGIGILLAEGIGDTVRVSLTASPVEEVLVADEILKALELRKGLNIIACPTCGRTAIDIINMTALVEEKLKPYKHCALTVAVMGCVVNGPGEAKTADFGIAGGNKKGIVFMKGETVKTAGEDSLVDELIKCIEDNI